MCSHERVQCGGRRIGQDLHPAPAEPARLRDLNCYTHQGFLASGTSAAQARLLTADVGLVDLDRAGQPVPARAHQHRPQPMQHRPRGRVRADLQRAFQAQRGHPVLAGREQPARLEPHRQWRAPTVEQRPCRHRRAPAARRALVPAVRDQPASRMATPWTHEALRPAQPVQVVQAVRIGDEPRPELTSRPRVVHPRPRPQRAHVQSS